MALDLTEINLYKSQSGDGGRRSKNDKVSSGSVGAVVERITGAEYAAGYDRTYKLFFAVDNDADETAYGCYLILDAQTAGDDYATIYAGTPRDDASDHSSPRLYGVASLVSDYTAGDPSIVVEVEDVSLTGIFADGDDIAISIGGDPEIGTISGAPSVSGTEITITLAAGFANSYTVAAGGRLSSAIDVGDILASYDNFGVTGSGSYDDTTFPVVLDNLGTIEQTWVLEMLDSENFTCTGDAVGTLSANGSTLADFAPINPISGKPYFTLRAGGHGGTPAGGGIIGFQTHGPEYGFYLNIVGPAGASEVSGRVTPTLIVNP